MGGVGSHEIPSLAEELISTYVFGGWKVSFHQWCSYLEVTYALIEHPTYPCMHIGSTGELSGFKIRAHETERENGGRMQEEFDREEWT